MIGVTVRNVTGQNMDDLCWVCMFLCQRDDPDWARGAADKKKWAAEVFPKWGSFAKVAYEDDDPAGMIQYRPSSVEQVVRIDCIYVPVKRQWGKGIGSRLLGSLMDDVQKPMSWFDNKRPLALVTTTFRGGAPEQYTAREFFTRNGFRQIGKNADHLYYPLQPRFVYNPIPKKEVRHTPQDEDKGKVVIVSGPGHCPATYPYFLKRMEKYTREIAPGVSIRWIDSSEEPGEVKKRAVSVGDCIANARLIRSCVLDKDSFQEEVQTALR
jgi:GNAT superfamily N-acetyltransferase